MIFLLLKTRMSISLENKQLLYLLEEYSGAIGVHVRPIDALFENKTYKHFLENKLHGFHPLFYWQRTRGNGYWLFNNDVHVVCSFRNDIGIFQLVRPCGATSKIIQVCEDISSALSESFPYHIVVRYCSKEVASRLTSGSFNEPDDFVWNHNSPLDDETYSQVIYPLNKIVIPKGTGNRMIRQSIYKHDDVSSYRGTNNYMIELEKAFVLGLLPISANKSNFDDMEIQEFIRSTFDAIQLIRKKRICKIICHRLLDNLGTLKAFAVSGQADSRADMYLFSHLKEKRLATYFLYKIAEYHSNNGAVSLNLGGSETSSLHQFKVNFSSHHFTTRSHLLKYEK